MPLDSDDPSCGRHFRALDDSVLGTSADDKSLGYTIDGLVVPRANRNPIAAENLANLAARFENDGFVLEHRVARPAAMRVVVLDVGDEVTAECHIEQL